MFYRKRELCLLKMTESAAKILTEAIQREQSDETEKLYIRLSMGIG